MNKLKDLVTRQALRIDAMSLRERAIMFVSLAVALTALTDALVLSPQAATQQALTERLVAGAAELAELQQRSSGALATHDTPQGQLRLRLASVQTQQASVDEAINGQLSDGQTLARLPALLERVLRRHERLTLLKLDSAAPAPTASTATAAENLIPVRRGVQLQLAGRHADLVAYLAEIEQKLPGLRWAELQVDARPALPVMTVLLYLPGGDA